MTLSKSAYSISLFEILKIFYPPEGLAEQSTGVIRAQIYKKNAQVFFFLLRSKMLSLKKMLRLKCSDGKKCSDWNAQMEKNAQMKMLCLRKMLS